MIGFDICLSVRNTHVYPLLRDGFLKRGLEPAFTCLCDGYITCVCVCVSVCPVHYRERAFKLVT